MSTCTPIYGLAQVECSDRPCDVNDTLCQFANNVEAQLDALDAVANRTATTVPMVILERNDPFVITAGIVSQPEFQSVLVDTDNMADLTTLNTGFIINTPGIYFLWLYVRGSGTSLSPNMDTNITIQRDVPTTPFGSSFFMPQLDVVASVNGWPMVGSTGGEMDLTAGTQLYPRFSSSGFTGDTATFTSYMFGASFIRDLS